MDAAPPYDWTKGLPRLESELVAVREVTTDDAPALHELLCDPRVTPDIGPLPPTVEAFEGFAAWARRERVRGSSFCFGIVPHGLDQAVGIIQVRALGPTFFVSEWGFALGAAFWATGVFHGAATLVAAFTFKTVHAHRLEARAVATNGRGSGALQKLGARAEAVLTKAFRRPEGYDEQLLWTLISTQWPCASQERVGIAEARQRVRLAIAAVHLPQPVPQPAVAPAAPHTPTGLYPFFITQAPLTPYCGACGTRIEDSTCPHCSTQSGS